MGITTKDVEKAVEKAWDTLIQATDYAEQPDLLRFAIFCERANYWMANLQNIWNEERAKALIAMIGEVVEYMQGDMKPYSPEGFDWKKYLAEMRIIKAKGSGKS